MNKMNKGYFIVAILFGVMASFACNKSEYLSKKPDLSLVDPQTLDDYQAILDNTGFMNGIGNGVVPALGEAASDNYYVVSGGFSGSAANPAYKNLYTWNDDIWSVHFEDWSFPYRAIFYSNVVLEGISKLDTKSVDPVKFNAIKGSALFFRAHMFYQLAQIFSPPYNTASADVELGIPLKLRADINERVSRPTLQATYDRIIDDLMEAQNLLPKLSVQGVPSRPSKEAALALLSRVYLSMGDYESALTNADACLQLYDTLLDFNDNTWVNTSGSIGIRMRFNPEVLFACNLIVPRINSLLFSTARARVDSTLYYSYNTDDLRRSVFFRTASSGGQLFKGSYDASSTLFGGIGTDEIYLIRAECNARKGNTEKAMEDLNKLLKSRWKNTVTYTPIEVTDPGEALGKVLTERRKELIFRGLRWTDLRRLNLEGENIILQREVDEVQYTLQPNDKRYTFLLPPDVISFNTNWPQNPR